MTTRCRKSAVSSSRRSGDFDAFDHDASRHGVQPCVFLRGQLASCEDDNWDVAQIGIGAKLLQDLKAGHVGEFEVENHTIAALLAHTLKGLFASLCSDDLNVIMGQ